MDIIFFIPIGFFLIIVFLLLGGLYSLAQAFTEMLFNICASYFLIYGMYLLIRGIVVSIKEQEVGYGIVEFFRGTFISVICLWVNYFLKIGQGHVTFDKANYVLFGTFETLDINMASIFISVILIGIVSSPVLMTKNEKDSMIKYISIILLIVSYIGIYKIGLISEFNNSRETFNWDSPEYEVIQDADIKHEEYFFNPVNTGEFKKGTLLYKNNYSKKINGVEYYEVTDGERVGYVSSECIKELVRYTYIVNINSNVYRTVQEQITAWKPGEGTEEILVSRPSDEVIAIVTKGTVVELTDVQFTEFLLIRLSDGTEGFIESKNLDEIRE